ncbi:hypothetical protein PJN38_24165 [Mycobacterium kansasii]
MDQDSIPGFADVVPFQQSAYKALCITGSDESTIAVKRGLQYAMAQGFILYGAAELTTEGGSLSWRIKITTLDGQDRFADPGDYLVISDTALRIYNGPNGKRNNPNYADYFPAEDKQ